ncbi:MAG: hypothetical protein ACRDE5_17695, partial [Ginsengibacter sp.]
MKQLSVKLRMPLKTLQTWIYSDNAYLPLDKIPEDIISSLDILDKKEDNWGRVLGGKNSYKRQIEMYGKRSMLKRQIAGGKASKKNIFSEEKPFNLDILNKKFLEFYGVLLGDGWLSQLKYKKKFIWLIGIAGDKRYDKEFYAYLKANISELFN